MYPFGKDFSYGFTPLVDGEEVAGIPAHTAKLFVYSSMPSRAQVIDETGSIGSATLSWTANATSGTFSVTAIDDPAPSSEVDRYDYWVGIKIKLDADEDYEVFTQVLKMERAGGQNKTLTVVKADLVEVWDLVGDFFSDTAISNAILTEKSKLKAILKAQGYEWALIHRLDQMKLALSFNSLALLAEGRIAQDGETFGPLARTYRASAKTLSDEILGSLPYDATRSGQPDSTVKSRGWALALR